MSVGALLREVGLDDDVDVTIDGSDLPPVLLGTHQYVW
jgi:hypothetical protein